MSPESDRPIAEQYHNYEIEYWHHATLDTLARLSRALVRAASDGEEVFRAGIDVTTQWVADRQVRNQEAMKFAASARTRTH